MAVVTGLQPPRWRSMKDIQANLEKLLVQIAECEMIRDLATEPKKRELFGRLAEHLRILAADLERALPGHHDGLPGHKTQEPLPKDVSCAAMRGLLSGHFTKVFAPGLDRRM